ncbi:MAG: hypothetical protein NT031_02990 [Planctomycetota bacterium]|nr:hypothetical protein [Planctomycetota bacterium]
MDPKQRSLVPVTAEQSVARASAKQASCIVMICGGKEAGPVERELAGRKIGRLMAYHRVEDMVQSPPAGPVAMVILAKEEDPAGTRKTLRWLRQRWPSCPITLVSGDGGVDREMTARQGGAFYLTSGEAARQLPAMVSHALRAQVGETAGILRTE